MLKARPGDVAYIPERELSVEERYALVLAERQLKEAGRASMTDRESELETVLRWSRADDLAKCFTSGADELSPSEASPPARSRWTQPTVEAVES